MKSILFAFLIRIERETYPTYDQSRGDSLASGKLDEIRYMRQLLYSSAESDPIKDPDPRPDWRWCDCQGHVTNSGQTLGEGTREPGGGRGPSSGPKEQPDARGFQLQTKDSSA